MLKNRPDLVQKARAVFEKLARKIPANWDDRGNIGKRYYYQDEIGTPYCVTVDFVTLENDTVTVRDRDRMKQERVSVEELLPYLQEKIEIS